MGQPVTVIEEATPVPGVYRYDTNRTFSGMGHEVFTSERPPLGDRPVDELARRLFARGGVESVHVNGGVVTVKVSTVGSEGIKEIIENLYRFYKPGDQPELPSEPASA